MLGEAVTSCPDTLWLAPEYLNRYWHIAYHALFYTHLYLHTSETDFHPWAKHKKDYQFLGPVPWPPHERPQIDVPYSKEDILEYLQLCRSEIGPRMQTVDFAAPSGFPWYPVNKLELQFINIRHIQHHGAQLIDRLRTISEIPSKWVGTVPIL